MLPITSETIRLFIHVLAATIWVGGQLVLAGLVPGLRALNPEAPKFAARRFNRMAWAAYGILILTGAWNIAAEHAFDRSNAYMMTLMIKITVVLLSGLAAFAHSISRSKKGLAIWGAVSGLSALAALFFGIMLATG